MSHPDRTEFLRRARDADRAHGRGFVVAHDGREKRHHGLLEELEENVAKESTRPIAYTSGTVGRWPLRFKPKPVGTRIPMPLQKRVRQHAAESGCFINDIVETALEEHLRRMKLTAPGTRLTIVGKKGPEGGR